MGERKGVRRDQNAHNCLRQQRGRDHWGADIQATKRVAWKGLYQKHRRTSVVDVRAMVWDGRKLLCCRELMSLELTTTVIIIERLWSYEKTRIGMQLRRHDGTWEISHDNFLLREVTETTKHVRSRLNPRCVDSSRRMRRNCFCFGILATRCTALTTQSVPSIHFDNSAWTLLLAITSTVL